MTFRLDDDNGGTGLTLNAENVKYFDEELPGRMSLRNWASPILEIACKYVNTSSLFWLSFHRVASEAHYPQ